MKRLLFAPLLAFLGSGCPDTEVPPLGLVDGTRVCSTDEIEAFQNASFDNERTDLWIAFVDVGQGDGIWIRTPGEAGIDAQEILVDAGDCRVPGASCLVAGDGSGGVNGAGAMVQFMTENGWGPGNPIDYLVATHADIDHFGGARRVLNEYNVKAYMDPGLDKEGSNYEGLLRQIDDEPNLVKLRPVAQTGLNRDAVGAPRAANCIGLHCTNSWGRNLDVRLLAASSSATEANDSSIVLMLEYRGQRVLLTGDAEEALDQTLVAQYGASLQADVLKAGHHGGAGTSTAALLDAVFPDTQTQGLRVGIISSGRRDNLPAADTFDRLAAKVGGVGLYRTDRFDEGKSQSEAPGDDHILVRINDDGNLTVCYAYPDQTLAE